MARLEEFDDVQLDVEFTQAGTRSNLTSKENIAISFGKIAKWYEALVPTGGSSGQFLGFNSSGTAKWVSNPNVDEKVKATKLAQSTVEASYYPTLVAGEGTAGVSIIDSAKINHTPGTTSIVGNTRLILGNGINEGATNNEAGLLRIYSSGTKYHTLKGAKITTDNVDHTLPTIGGTILNTGTTSFTQTLSSGTKIGTIKINGTSSDIYAPTDTDTKVTQTNTTTSADYRVLLSGNANDTTETTTGRKSTNLRFNPSSGGLYSFGFLWTDITGQTLDINTLTLSDGTLHSRRFIEKTDGGASNITNIPVTGHPFLLEVDLIRWGSTTDYITRQRFTNAANGTYSYVRYCTNGTWGSWTTRKYTDTDTKVTSSANHYAPATVSGQDKSASASGATAAWSIDVVKGVTLNTDGKGHVTGLSVTSGKIPSNPVPSNNVTGSGTSGYLTKWNGANTITNGPQLGSSTTTFLRNDGTWATPTNTDTKVTQSQTTTTNYRPILFGAKDSTDISTLANTVTDQAYTSTKMFAKPDTGILYASGFSTSSFINGTGAQLNQYGLYLKSYKSASLPAGGNYSYEEYAIRVYDGKSIDNNGMLLTIDGGGLTIVGGGESAKSLAALISDDQRDSNTSRTRLDVGGTLNTAYHGSEEQLILSSDNNIYFLTTCQTIANRKPVVLDVNSYFYPGTTKTGSIGTSSYMWNSVYAATIYENGTSLASKYAAIGHTHGLIHSNLNQIAANGTTGGWSVIGIDPAVAAFVLKSIRINQTSPNWLCGDYGAGIAFGGADTKGVISMKYQSPVITFAGGNHSSSKTEPVWYLKISGTSGSTYNLANFYDSTISRTANTVLAAPNGSDGAASFRKLVAADIPTLNYIGAKSDGSYYGMTNPAGADNVWIRTTSLGIIPYQSGNAGSGHGSLGTSSWYFSYAYIDNIYGSLNGNATTATKATQDGDGNTISSTYLKLSGGIMTGQLKTSFKESVAVGSYQAQATKIPDLCTELRYSSGAMGSVALTEAYTKDGITIAATWYNFIWIPHRSGGVNGAASGDNCNYGSLILSGMTGSGAFIIRYASGSIAELKYLYKDTTYSANNGVGLSGTTFYNSGVRAVSTGSANGTISVNTNGTTGDVAVKGLASAAYVTQESLLRARSTVSTDGGATGWSQIGINQYNDAYPDGVTNKIYGWGAVVSMPAPNARFDLYYNHNSSTADRITNGLQYRTGWNDDKKAWRMLIDNVNYTEYMPYKKPIKFQFNNGITNGYWAKLFSANYSDYNILEIDIVTYHGYDGNFRSKLRIRFTSAGFVPGESSIISHQNIAPDSLRITQDDTNTFSLWIKCDGTSSRFGYEILNISDESSVFFNGVTLTAARWSFPTTFTKSDTAPTNAVTATRYFALDNHTHNYAGSSSAGGAATSANILNKNNTAGATTAGVQYVNGQLTVGTADGNAVEGSNASYKLWSYPAGGTAVGGGTANIQNLRLYWSSTWFRDIFISPNNCDIYHRSVAAGTAQPWRKVLDSGNYTSYALPRNIKHIHTASGTEGSVGWVKIARITVTNAYANHPMTFTIAQRSVMQYRIHLVLVNNSSVAAAAISQFIIARDNSWTDTNNNPRAYIIKPSDGIFDLYIRKTENYDHIFVVDFTKADGSEGDNYSVTWTNVHAADSEITGGTEAVKKLYLSTSGGTMTGELKQTTQLRIYSGNYGTIFRNDGTNTFFLLTESGSAESGSWNSLRPLYFSNSTGKVTIGNGLTVYNGITGDLTGNASTATKLETARNIALAEDFAGSANFDGSGNISISGTFYRCSASSNNTANYPWHRIAYRTGVTDIYNDTDAIFMIRAFYNGGPFGIIKVTMRTNASGFNCQVAARWVVRQNIAANDVYIAQWGTSGQSVYADIFLKGTTYNRTYVYQIAGNRTWTLVNSGEASDTTTSDKKTSTEVYASIAAAGTTLHNQAYTQTVAGIDEGHVNSANSATYATRANYLDVVAGNEVRFYNNNQVKEARHFWLGYSWADGSHYTPSGGSDTSSTTAPNITKFVMGNCSGGGLTSVHAKTFILGNGSSPTLSSKTTTITTAATTTDRTITLPDDSGTVALTSKTFNVTRGYSVSTATTGYWAAMCNSTQAGSPTLPTAGKWWHVISMDWTNNDINNLISQLAIATQDGSGVWWRQNDTGGTTIDSSSWHRLAEGNSSGAATNIATEVGSAAGARPVFYGYLGDNTRVVYNTNFTYNPSGNVLKASTFDGEITSVAFHNRIYALSQTPSGSTWNGNETLITSIPSSSGTSTPSYQRVKTIDFVKDCISGLKEPVLYENTTNPTTSTTIQLPNGIPKYLKVFIGVEYSSDGSTYSDTAACINCIDVDMAHTRHGGFIGYDTPGQSGVGNFLAYCYVNVTQNTGSTTAYTVGISYAKFLNLANSTTISNIIARIVKIIAVY